MKNIYCLFFDDYETLDIMGPIDLLFRLPEVKLHYVSLQGGWIRSKQNFSIMTLPMVDILPKNSILLVPGGQGTRTLVNHAFFLKRLAEWVAQSQYTLSVCTGSALLAAAGCLDHIQATSNKRAFEWVKNVRTAVDWQAVARWVHDGKFYTSSGVSAGMDMTLGFIADIYGMACAQNIAFQTEYSWQYQPQQDDFAGHDGDHAHTATQYMQKAV